MSDQSVTHTATARIEEQRRELAIQRLKNRRDFRVHLVSYVVVNVALVALWYLMGGGGAEPGFFWPIFPLAGWSIGLALHAYVTYLPPSVTDADIQREVERLQ